jgi:hypothetical protein
MLRQLYLWLWPWSLTVPDKYGRVSKGWVPVPGTIMTPDGGRK